MQSCLLNFNAKSRLSANQMVIKICIAAPTRKNNRIGTPTEKPLRPTWSACSQYNGFYDVSRLKRAIKLQKAEDYYKLGNETGYGLFYFLQNQYTIAIYHMYKYGSLSRISVEFDKPWQLQTKSISQLTKSSMKPMTALTYEDSSPYFEEPITYLNVIPDKALMDLVSFCKVLIEIKYDDIGILVAFVMEIKFIPSDVTSVLIKSRDKWFDKYNYMRKEPEEPFVVSLMLINRRLQQLRQYEMEQLNE